MIFDEECLLIVAQNVYVGVSGTTGRVLLFLPVSSQGYQGSFQDGEGELLPDIVHSVRIRTVQLKKQMEHTLSIKYLLSIWRKAENSLLTSSRDSCFGSI